MSMPPDRATATATGAPSRLPLPKLVTALRDYTRQMALADVTAGVTVGFVVAIAGEGFTRLSGKVNNCVGLPSAPEIAEAKAFEKAVMVGKRSSGCLASARSITLVTASGISNRRDRAGVGISCRCLVIKP